MECVTKLDTVNEDLLLVSISLRELHSNFMYVRMCVHTLSVQK